jgi:FkbM family methyltransferase
MSGGRPRIDTVAVRLAAWWARRNLPRAPHLLRRMGVWDDEVWRDGGVRECRGGLHGYRMRLDTRDYHQRGAFFFGRLLDMDLQLLVAALLRKGETFIDVGANIGMVTMLAARLVGTDGHVIAIEPNPDVFEELTWHVQSNGLDRVAAQRVALGKETALESLSVPMDNPGGGTLGTLPMDGRSGGKGVHEVLVKRGDDVFQDLKGPVVIKLDVEGHEAAALRGLARTIEAVRPALIVESNADMLRANGSSVAELFETLAGFGYRPLAVSVSWKRWSRRWVLAVHRMPVSWRPTRTQNVLFLRTDGEHESRVQGLIRELPARRQ